ncbi:hypothetical protein G7Y79_00046g082000 [Physcia stellaris]|nr:hypothetical protein G7Y79_00046g082000 [Physcia stellaris]
MSSSVPSTALVSSSAQVTGGHRFAQQGTVDWVTLGQSQWSASVAILGRLSSAGVEPLTVAVGQAVCSQISLGVRGERLLRDSMADLKACSSFGDLVWFGVGVHHILRVLVQTSQGASLVALCAALSESHSLSTSALILYEMTKRSGSPKELTPSFAQWEALVRVCSSTFAQTTFGIRIDQMMRLVGCGLREHTSALAGHPQDLAEILCAIGNVTSSDSVNIQVLGGPACSWVAVFADFVLGLRVLVRGSEGQTLFVNFNTSITQAQIEIEIGSGLPEDRIACIGRSFSLRNGDAFIRNFIHGKDTAIEGSISTEPFLGGKLSWSSMLRDTFGATAENLLNPHSASPMNSSQEPHVSTTLGQAFVDFFIVGAVYYTQTTVECNRYSSIHDFVFRATAYLSELEPIKQNLLRAASHWEWASNGNMSDRFMGAFLPLFRQCRCVTHRARSLDGSLHEPFCSVAVAETILVLSYLLGQANIAGSLQPRREGLTVLYDNMEREWLNPRHCPIPTSITNRALERLMPQHKIDGFLGRGWMPQRKTDGFPGHGWTGQRKTDGFVGLFVIYMLLFSGVESCSLSLEDSVSGVSDGKIYCFADSVRELSDRYETASIVRIGAGMIQSGDRLHYSIFDEPKGIEAEYETQQLTPFHGTVLEALASDTTSPELKIEAMVEEDRNLTFWYRLCSSRGNILISPGIFVKHLKQASPFNVNWGRMFRGTHLNPVSGVLESARASGRPVNIMKAHGEGSLPDGYESESNRIIVRPHHNNRLGRCAAIALSPQVKGLINEPQDLDNFATIFFYPKYRVDCEGFETIVVM